MGATFIYPILLPPATTSLDWCHMLSPSLWTCHAVYPHGDMYVQQTDTFVIKSNVNRKFTM